MQMVSCPRLSETVPAKLTKGARWSRHERIEIDVSGNKRGTAEVKCVLQVVLTACLVILE